ncbi:MAG: UPF0280 family protein [Dehalococcoidia bacterium]|jgi:ApbE superfamily uncharacterized protein (UPF0280 family)
MYEQRTYRHKIKGSGLVSFTAKVKETDLFILAQSELSGETLFLIDEYRRPLEKYIRSHPLFLHSLEPLSVDEAAPEIVRLMARAGKAARVGPMAAVAGAMAELVGNRLLEYSQEVIVENGGDIFMKISKRRRIGIFAGDSPFTGKLALEIDPKGTPLGICTSSGTVGPSLSLGSTDATIVLSRSAALADAAATAIGNLVKTVDDIQDALNYGREIKDVTGIVIVMGGRMGAWGDIKLIKI